MAIGLALAQSAEAAQRIVLAREGQSRYKIAMAGAATKTERFAATELTHFLSRVTTAAFPIVAEADLDDGAPAVYLGWTAYAQRQGIDPATLGEEEWIIRTVGRNLILTGGRPRGTLFAVYEFLERQVGCHWLDRRTEVVPDRPTLTVGPLDVRAKPWFWMRHVGNPHGSPADHWLFLVRNRNCRYDQPHTFSMTSDRFPPDTFHPLTGAPGNSHTFSKFVNAKDWFETHPEYFSLVAGKRLPAYSGSGPGQLCLAHPDVRRLTIEKLRQFVALDREKAAEKRQPPPRLYSISQNDRYRTHCQCDACGSIVEREGGESGPLVGFVNAVAAAVEPDCPDILVKTSAYNLTQPPPRTLRPRGNVLIGWCDVYSKCDVLRPLSHPYNRHHYDQIKRWCEIAEHVGIGDDYWTMLGYYNEFPLPWTMAQCLGPDIRHYADVGCETYFCEAAYYTSAGKNFIDMEYWLAFQLLINPRQPVEPLIETFMKGYYGAAAPALHTYYRYLTGRIDREAPFLMLREAPHLLPYLDLDFFVTTRRIFDEAEGAVAPGSLAFAHVLRDRFIVDSALLYLWPWLERRLPAGQSLPFDHEELVQRFEQGWKNYTKHWFHAYYTKGHWYNPDGKRLERLTALFRDPQLPEQFRNLPRSQIADFNWLTFSSLRPRQKFVPDPDAVGGMAAEPTGLSAILAAEEGAPVQGEADVRPPGKLTFGVTGGPTVTLPPENIPQDGKYHLYRIGRVQVQPMGQIQPGSGRWMPKLGTMVWALEGRKLGVYVDRVHVSESDDPDANVWNAYISLKVRGPAFVKGSTDTNGVWMDRVLLVKPQPGEKPDAAALRAQARQAASRPTVRVPLNAEGAGGDPRRVDWTLAADGGKWATLIGDPTTRRVGARFARDKATLYIRLTEEALDSNTLEVGASAFDGDHWELLFAAQRGEPYRQIGIKPDGTIGELAYGESGWESGARVVSEVGADRWTLWLAFPLDRLLPGGAKPGQTVYANILRGGRDPSLAWSPTYGRNFNLRVEALGEIVLK